MKKSDFIDCSERLTLFFKEYFEDVTSLISRLKSNVYQIINIDLNYKSSHQNIQIKPNLESILTFCEQTYQDLRRTTFLLEGYLISKQKRISSRNKKESKVEKDEFDRSDFTFQNNFKASILSSLKRDEFQSDSLTLNSENDWNLLNQGDRSKNDLKNDKRLDGGKVAWDEEFVDGKSLGEKLIKRNSFLVKKHNNEQIIPNSHHIIQRNELSIGYNSRDMDINIESVDLIKGQLKNRNRMDKGCYKNESIVESEQSQAQTIVQSNQRIKRSPKVTMNTTTRNSECLNLIRSIRKELSI